MDELRQKSMWVSLMVEGSRAGGGFSRRTDVGTNPPPRPRTNHIDHWGVLEGKHMAKAMSRSNIAVSSSVVRPTVRDKTIFSIEETRKDSVLGFSVS